MEIFDYIKNVLFYKKPYQSKNIEALAKYNSFSINRWVSMYDGDSAKIINETTNKINYFQNDKEMHYKMLLNLIPKKQYRRIEYIKKNIKENNGE